LDQTTGPTFTCNTPGVGSPGTITCTIATLAPNASATFSIVVRLAPNVPGGGSVSNTANVSTTTVDPDPDNNMATTTATTAVSADVGVAKSGPDSVVAGSTVTYTIVVTNGGPSDASSVSLTDTLPPGTTFGSLNQTTGSSFTCNTPGPGGTGTITCSIATLASGASATFSLVLNVSATATGTLANTAGVSATTADPASGNNNSTASTTVSSAADLEIVKSAALGGASAAGKSVTYTIVVTNHGPAVASNAVVTDVLPADATLTSATTTQGSCAGSSTVTCTLGTLAPGASATITLAVTFPPTAGTVSNTATVASSNPDPNPGNNSSTADLPAAAAIPTLSPLAFAVLGLTLLLAGFFVLRARRRPFPTP